MSKDVRRGAALVALVLGLLPSLSGASPVAAQTPSSTVTVEPATGLADSQRVTVTVTGPLEGEVRIRQCQAGATDSSRCATPEGVYLDHSGSGTSTTTIAVDNAIGLLDGTTVDCRVPAACELVAGDPSSPERSATAALGFDPAAPLVAPPTLAVEPTSGVEDRDEVTVSGSGFRTGAFLQVVQCRAAGAFPDNCDLGASQDVTGRGVVEEGALMQGVTVDAVFRALAGEVVDCRPAGACVLLAVGDEEAASAVLGFDAAAALRPPVMTVAPAAGLVDGQLVDVEVDGSRGPLRQCAAAQPEASSCGSPRYLDHDSVGGPPSTSTRFAVDASFRTSDGTTVDCRTSTCTLVAGNIEDPGDAAVVVLGFDPDAPLRPSAVVTVEPDDGLVDGQTVTVRATGFLPGVGVGVDQCPPAEPGQTGCDGSRSFGVYQRTDQAGSFVATLAVDAVLTGADGVPVDCRASAEPCRLVVRPFDGDDDVAVVPLGFDPGAALLPPPTVTVEPSTELADGSVVTARGTGFRPGWVAVHQCPAGVAATSPCGDRIGSGQVGLAGDLAVSVEIRGAVRDAGGRQVDCTGSPGACVLVVRNERGGPPSNAVPLSFAPSPPRGRYLDEVFEAVTVTRDVVYRRTTDPEGRPLDLRIDIYAPAGDTASSRPAMLWMHGGYFTSGDKRNMAPFAEAMARRGYVSASVQYRLDSDPNIGVRADHAYEDLRAAVAWLVDHAEEHGVDPRAIATGGYSAGAVTALNLAYAPDRAAGDAAGVAAAVSLAGVQTRGTVEAGEPPSLFFHAPNDDIVPYTAGRAVCDRVLAAGIVCDFVTYEGVGHGLTTFDDDITRRTADFLAANVLDPLGYFGPVADAGGPYSVVEGSTVTLDGTGSSGDALTYDWSPADRLTDPTGPRPLWRAVDDGHEVFQLEVRDAAGATARSEATVVVQNAPPVIDSLTVGPARGGRHKKVRLAYSDPGPADTHTVSVDWGDGTETVDLRGRRGGPTSVRAGHTYAQAGTYTVTATVVDDDGGTTASAAATTVRAVPSDRPARPPHGRLR